MGKTSNGIIIISTRNIGGRAAPKSTEPSGDCPSCSLKCCGKQFGTEKRNNVQKSIIVAPVVCERTQAPSVSRSAGSSRTTPMSSGLGLITARPRSIKVATHGADKPSMGNR
ncbi:hypothetical protein DdX_04711 [Ditylenchus destructor]|uniref:Uncharacterized protein n=1 Tax=Ditylenchus destructor TaxID=166010 RepID=A0AAD4N8D3_9BILA|nr:hypothetical protein DdX_04711 [Ditylenchus destructor]